MGLKSMGISMYDVQVHGVREYGCTSMWICGCTVRALTGKLPADRHPLKPFTPACLLYSFELELDIRMYGCTHGDSIGKLPLTTARWYCTHLHEQWLRSVGQPLQASMHDGIKIACGCVHFR